MVGCRMSIPFASVTVAAYAKHTLPNKAGIRCPINRKDDYRA